MAAVEPAPRYEVCVESVSGCLAAEAGGADRVELCANLLEGGTTPSSGAVEGARAHLSIGLVVLLRPRPGDFLYDELELETLLRDLRRVRELGADGVALGFLCRDGAVDAERTARCVEAAAPLDVCFHRAFDHVRDPFEALETLAGLGVARVLTSGGAPSAEEGRARIAGLVAAAAGRLAVVAAGGVRAHNAARIVAATGVRELHGSASGTRPSPMEHRNPACLLGSPGAPGEYELRTTEEERVRAVVRALRAR